MSPNRRREFIAGRAHARQVLESLGLVNPSLPVGKNRAPVWPAGFVGSISHGGALVLAVAAPGTRLAAIGVDVEPSTPLEADLLERVCRPEEWARLRGSPDCRQRAKLVFSAKESVYKCLAPRMGIFMEFFDLEIIFDVSRQAFRTQGHGPVANLIHPGTLLGSYGEAGGFWLTCAWQGP